MLGAILYVKRFYLHFQNITFGYVLFQKPPLKREDSFLQRFSTRQIPETQETVEDTGSEGGTAGIFLKLKLVLVKAEKSTTEIYLIIFQVITTQRLVEEGVTENNRRALSIQTRTFIFIGY